jgi:hypothetical protein
MTAERQPGYPAFCGPDAAAWENLFEGMLKGESAIVSELARKMRRIAEAERAAGIDPLHTVRSLVELVEDSAASLGRR